MAVPTTYQTIEVDGLNLFYRTAGCSKNPTILLLHGFPSSSHQYRNLIPLLAGKYHILAPDLPGFGFTTVPPAREYSYTFSSLATTVGLFLDALSIGSFSVYIFDYGAPTVLRPALQRPNAITAIISQNGNAYDEGLGPSGIRSASTGIPEHKRTVTHLCLRSRRAGITRRLHLASQR
jgi:pimeloyl-ACP methyl ester carboxylesterase